MTLRLELTLPATAQVDAGERALRTSGLPESGEEQKKENIEDGIAPPLPNPNH